MEYVGIQSRKTVCGQTGRTGLSISITKYPARIHRPDLAKWVEMRCNFSKLIGNISPT